MPTTTSTGTATSSKRQRGVVASLRALTPHRPLTFSESVRLAELQAFRLLQLTGCHQEDGDVPESVITGLPRLDVRRSVQVTRSGVSLWHRGKWHIRINALESYTRQRFSLAHELKHIIDAAHEDVIYRNLPADSKQRHTHIEAVCDAFAAALLMPRAWVRRLWYQGTQDLSVLAWHFHVSQQAMQIRLQTLGLLPRSRKPSYSNAAAYRLGQTAVQRNDDSRTNRPASRHVPEHQSRSEHAKGRHFAPAAPTPRRHRPLPDLQYIPDPDYIAATELEGACL